MIETRTDTKTIDLPRDASSPDKAQFTLYSVARACYGSLEAHIKHIEVLGLSSMFELEFCDQGFRMTEKKTDQNLIIRQQQSIKAFEPILRAFKEGKSTNKDWIVD